MAELGRLDDSALLGLRKPSIGDLTPNGPMVPSGFTRTPGGDGTVFSPVRNGQSLEMRKAT